MAASLFEYLPFDEALALYKFAAPRKPHQRAVAMLKAVGIPALGFAGGMATGHALTLLADKAYQSRTGGPIPAAYLRAIAPAVGLGLGLAYNKYQSHVQEELRRAFQSDPDDPGGRVP